ncbi:MAG TPA: TraB/GumN family protein [Candidatus Woesearchaeota archaeon]|nr:TraB/GumN family protein [Candidatus Woesearchaeota archaeon]
MRKSVLVPNLPIPIAPQDCVVRPERSEAERHAKASHKHELEFLTNLDFLGSFLKMQIILKNMKYKNLTIIGTSHIAKQSLDDVENAVEDGKPNIIALELDRRRLYSLFKKPSKMSIYDIKRVGIKGFIFALIGAWAEKKLGKIVGVAPGSEMKKAVRLARKHDIKLALIDQDIEITLKRFSKSLTWKEKWNFIIDIVKAIFVRKNVIEFDLTKVPSKKVIKKLVGQVKKRYPNIYKVLIEERNQVMAENLRKIMENYQDKKILAIIGAGHEDDILELIKKPSISYSFRIG